MKIKSVQSINPYNFPPRLLAGVIQMIYDIVKAYGAELKTEKVAERGFFIKLFWKILQQ